MNIKLIDLLTDVIFFFKLNFKERIDTCKSESIKNLNIRNFENILRKLSNVNLYE